MISRNKTESPKQGIVDLDIDFNEYMTEGEWHEISFKSSTTRVRFAIDKQEVFRIG